MTAMPVGYGFHAMSPLKDKARSARPVQLWPLLALNFFIADMQSGIGPFVGVFLQAHGWASGLIGSAMTTRRWQLPPFILAMQQSFPLYGLAAVADSQANGPTFENNPMHSSQVVVGMD